MLGRKHHFDHCMLQKVGMAGGVLQDGDIVSRKKITGFREGKNEVVVFWTEA